MRKLALLLGLTVALVSSPALAGGFDLDVTTTNAKAGIESVLTSVAAPVLGVVNGDNLFDLPCPEVTDRLVGLLTGTLGGAFALVTGAVDVVFAIPAGIVGIAPISPEPIIDLF